MIPLKLSKYALRFVRKACSSILDYTNEVSSSNNSTTFDWNLIKNAVNLIYFALERSE